MLTRNLVQLPISIFLLLVFTVLISGCQDSPTALPTNPVEESNPMPTATAVDLAESGLTPTTGSPGSFEGSVPTQEPVKPTDFPPGFPTPDAEIYADCLTKGGRWEVLGFSGPGCNLPTTDGGKACREITDCESACLADLELLSTEDGSGKFLTDQEKVEALNALEGEKVGVCSSWQQNFGCRIWLMDGRFVEMCVD